MKIIVASVFALCVGFITNVGADDCCGGQPLPSGDECCNDKPIDPNELFCCTTAQETGWQTSYNSCKATAQSTKDTEDKAADDAYHATVNGCSYIANADCIIYFTNPSPAYTVCFDGVMVIEGPVLTDALVLDGATLAADAVEFSDAKDNCSTDLGWIKTCADGWTLAL